MYLEFYRQISENVEKGRANQVKKLVTQALDEGCAADDILEFGLISAMERIGISFKNYHIFVPEVILAARAMNAAMEILEPKLLRQATVLGKAVIGSIEGDFHEIGKNLVTIMLKNAGIDTLDIGMNVSPEMFLENAEKFGADLICISASITTTMTNIPRVLKHLEQKGVRDCYTVLVGGAPLTESYCRKIGADGYTQNATDCAALAARILREKNQTE